MRTQPITTYNPSFGIYKYTLPKRYGELIHGEYKGYSIDIYNAEVQNNKLYYISDKLGKWIKSKLKYIENGKIKTIRSKQNGM